MIKVLNERDLAALRTEFLESRPFRNLILRLGDLKKFEWWLEDDYRLWATTADGLHEAWEATDPPARLRRVLVLERPRRRNGRKRRLVAGITLHYGKHAAFGEHAQHVGRTIITAPDLLVGPRAFLLSARHRLFIPDQTVGQRTVFSFAFAQQDRDYHRCIDVCLWSVLDYMSRHIGTRKLGIGELRRPGHNGADGLAPASGLFPDEVLDAITRTGLLPVYYSQRVEASERERPLRGALAHRSARTLEPEMFLEVLHAYLDSQLPPILLLTRDPRSDDGKKKLQTRRGPAAHSVVVVGHTAYDRLPGVSEQTPLVSALGFRTTTMYLTNLVVHDDDVGPYMRLRARGTPSGEDATPNWDPGELWWESLPRSGIGFFVALPPGVRMPAEKALDTCRRVLSVSDGKDEYLRRYVESVAEKLEGPKVEVCSAMVVASNAIERKGRVEAFLSAWRQQELVVGLYLEHSSRLKERVLKDKSLSKAERLIYLRLPLPKYLWVAEISYPSLMAANELSRRWVCGEILIDPTRSHYRWTVLAARFPGVITWRDSDGEGMLRVDSAPRVQWTLRNFEEEALGGIR